MLKWIGYKLGVEGLPGIPARDLSAEEVEQHGGEKALVATGLYVPVARPKPSKPIVEENHDPLED